jgi:3-oxoacyl-[acyl-carrier protein] reductase
MSEEQKIALVTGASRGIGCAIAEVLAQDGWRVAGTATSAAGAEAIGERLAATGGMGLVMDVADGASVDAGLAQVRAQLGEPLLLVNNAGITRDNIMLRMKDEEWDTVINTNLNSIYRLSRACLKAMTRARFGRIINISSVVGSMGNPGQANYAAAKGGVEAFTRALAREVGSRNITVNAVAPGFIETDMTDKLPEAQKQALLAQVPLQRLGKPEEIARAVAFLASDAAAYITGTTLHVNGGLYTG